MSLFHSLASIGQADDTLADQLLPAVLRFRTSNHRDDGYVHVDADHVVDREAQEHQDPEDPARRQASWLEDKSTVQMCQAHTLSL